MFELPEAGSASSELAREINVVWTAAAQESGIDLTGFDPDAPLAERIEWASRIGIAMGTAFVRTNSRVRNSICDQAVACTEYGARHSVYVPPEFVCIDSAPGFRSHGEGLDRLQLILNNRLAQAVLVDDLYRLFRSDYAGFTFLQCEVVRAGLRAISVRQEMDSSDFVSWNLRHWLLMSYRALRRANKLSV